MKHLICSLQELKQVKRKLIEINYLDILVLYSNDTVYAIRNKCPHRGIPLDNGTIDGEVITCKDHGLKISLKTGNVLLDRQINFLRLDKHSRSVTTFPVVIEDHNVYIEM